MLPTVSPMSDAKPPADSRVTLHQLMLPEHGNALGNVHGGVIMRVMLTKRELSARCDTLGRRA